ncbi:DUF2062 domain-containing protein [Desulfitibacter alkalitolerans]|uniref:DUF2062 domain-containing protein n=1 Tax=Desulfitibacter alkalitolerans TaxID=264641 RepID=UPI000480AD88|nr:DUF2062 domain-containing protein [Desulfitibacter alkalitolerans]
MPQKHFEKMRTKFREILKLKGSPHAIALGVAVGFFWNFIPSIGIGPFLSMGLARLIRGSAVAALTANLATGFFIPVFYSMNMITGRFLQGDKVKTVEIEESLQESLQESIVKIEEIVEQPASYFYLDKIQDFTADFLIGALVNAFIGATLIYFVIWVILNRRYKTRKHRECTDTNWGGSDV